jgi:hypothetical protein
VNAPSRLTHRNRARVTSIDPKNAAATGVMSDSAKRIFETIQNITAFLPVTIEYWQRDFPEDGFENVWAFGVEGGISPKKIKQMINALGGSEKLQKVIGSALPELR